MQIMVNINNREGIICFSSNVIRLIKYIFTYPPTKLICRLFVLNICVFKL